MKLKINFKAYQKLVFLRDYKPDEIAMFGLTYKEDPLHVYDFVIPKQKVGPVSADCDKDWMGLHIAQCVANGIHTINSSRIWVHTHPMTGANSANPSGKDMATWNDPDNKDYNFFVMMILSKSDHITCKLRIRGNLNNIVNGLNHPFDIEKDIPIEVVKSDEDKEYLKNVLNNFFTEDGIKYFGADSDYLINKLPITTIYPEFSNLLIEYAEKVTKDTPIYQNIPYTGNNSHYSSNYTVSNSKHTKKKKKVSSAIVPELMLTLSEHTVSLLPVDDQDIQKLANRYDDVNANSLQEAMTEFEYDNDPSTKTYIDVILGAMAGRIMSGAATTHYTNTARLINILHKNSALENRCTALNITGLNYPQFAKIATAINNEEGENESV